MPLYSELYHNFVGNTPIIPTPISVGSATYSPPTYVGVSRAYPNALTGALSGVRGGTGSGAPTFTRGYVPKLTPITETPLTSTRIAALGRVSSPKFLHTTSHGHGHGGGGAGAGGHHGHASPTYQKPRRTINTADIDVSASKYASRSTPLLTHTSRKSLVDVPHVPYGTGSPPSTSVAHLNHLHPAPAINSSAVPPAPAAPTDGAEPARLGPPASTTTTTRDQELSERSEQRRARSTINRNRAVVRLNTIRARSRSRGSRGSTERSERNSPDRLASATAGSTGAYDEQMLLLEPSLTGSRGTSGSSWRDNFREELAFRPRRTEPTKSPGELLLEKHLIREAAAASAAASASASTPLDATGLSLRSPVLRRRGTVRRKSAAKIPSFHEICADISSDKLDDDLNAGELRRRASQLIEDELLQFQAELKQVAANAAGGGGGASTGTMVPVTPETLEERLKEALEQQGQDDSGVEFPEKRKQKKVKRTKTKVLPRLDGEQQDTGVPGDGDVVVVQNSAPPPPPRLVAEVESIEECTLFKLPKKKKKPQTAGQQSPPAANEPPKEQQAGSSITPNKTTARVLSKSVATTGTVPAAQRIHLADLTGGSEPKQAVLLRNGFADASQPKETKEEHQRPTVPTDQPAPAPKTLGIKTYVRKKTVEKLEQQLEEVVSAVSTAPKGQGHEPPTGDSKQSASGIAEQPKAGNSVEERGSKELDEGKKLPMTEPPKEGKEVVAVAATVPAAVRKAEPAKPTDTKQPAVTPGFPDSKQNDVSLPLPAAVVSKGGTTGVESKVASSSSSSNSSSSISGAPEPTEGVKKEAPAPTAKKVAPPKSPPAAPKVEDPTVTVPPRVAPKPAPAGVGQVLKQVRKKPPPPPELKQSQPTKVDEVDFWSAIGTRETVSFARRKQHQLQQPPQPPRFIEEEEDAEAVP
ncbi:nucleolar protein dao-5-like [Anopheles darlingi]|uniref:nucleolar protein dao-5-like n=1 Tax=Anopheles darlingi TaxID=43151 RepID=UPI0021005B94|nr:nucleolar protein dao-5-like [Anopheles darlingi]